LYLSDYHASIFVLLVDESYSALLTLVALTCTAAVCVPARYAPPTGWSNDEMGLDWLKNVFD
jgi:hypothetical protein